MTVNPKKRDIKDDAKEMKSLLRQTGQESNIDVASA